jgi:TonB family protein
MRNNLLLALLLLTLCGFLTAQSLPEPVLASAGLPRYPWLARLNHIQGRVMLAVDLDSAGHPAKIDAKSGDPVLKAAAIDSIRSWQFDMPHDLYRTRWNYEVEFSYVLSKEAVDGDPTLRVTLHTFHHVEVFADPAITRGNSN